METWQIAVIVVVLLVVVAVAWMVIQRRRTERLSEKFGPEYQRTVEASGAARPRPAVRNKAPGCG